MRISDWSSDVCSSDLSGDDLTASFLSGDDPEIEVVMHWFILIVAGLFEVGWAVGLKYTEGFTRLWPSVGTVLAMIISLGLLGIAMKSLPLGTRSEERRVGKECVSTCRSRWSPYH